MRGMKVLLVKASTDSDWIAMRIQFFNSIDV